MRARSGQVKRGNRIDQTGSLRKRSIVHNATGRFAQGTGLTSTDFTRHHCSALLLRAAACQPEWCKAPQLSALAQADAAVHAAAVSHGLRHPCPPHVITVTSVPREATKLDSNQTRRSARPCALQLCPSRTCTASVAHNIAAANCRVDRHVSFHRCAAAGQYLYALVEAVRRHNRWALHMLIESRLPCGAEHGLPHCSGAVRPGKRACAPPRSLVAHRQWHCRNCSVALQPGSRLLALPHGHQIEPRGMRCVVEP